MRHTVFALSLTLLTGCAGAYKTSYVTGAVTKQVATEAYNPYSELFNDKLDECCANDACNPESPNVITKTQLDECMGPAYEKATHDKIETASKAYYEIAEIHTSVMKSVDASPEEMKAVTNELVASAIDLIALLPDGDKLVAKLKMLIGKK